MVPGFLKVVLMPSVSLLSLFTGLICGMIVFLIFTEDENLVFRGNSFATKAMDSYMKMIGESVSGRRLQIVQNPSQFNLRDF